MNAVVKAKTELPVQQTDAAAMLAVIQTASTDPAVDVEKVERLYAIYERIKAKEAEAEFNNALARVQSEMGRISADAVNPQTRSRYASYGALDKVLRPIYSKEGLSLSFDTGDAPQPDQVRVLCYVSKGAHTRTYHTDMDASGKGAKGGDVMTKTHAAGAAMSYGSRYLLKMIFNVAIGENDDDGNGASEDYPADWIAKVEECDNMDALNKVADLLKKEMLGKKAMNQVRAAWSARAKALKGAK
jgi:hypothetical protein